MDCLHPYSRPADSDEATPGLTVRETVFRSGECLCRSVGSFPIDSVLTLTRISGSIANFGFMFGESFHFRGEVGVDEHAAMFFPEIPPDSISGGTEDGRKYPW